MALLTFLAFQKRLTKLILSVPWVHGRQQRAFSVRYRRFEPGNTGYDVLSWLLCRVIAANAKSGIVLDPLARPLSPYPR
jgi:hypothetical protein